MTREQKIWAARRDRYGHNGGNPCAPRALSWIPPERMGRYLSLKRMHGADTAKEMIRLEMKDAATS